MFPIKLAVITLLVLLTIGIVLKATQSHAHQRYGRSMGSRPSNGVKPHGDCAFALSYV